MTSEVIYADVIIVGAGLAGLSAASTLADHNVTNFIILEARDRIGGRVSCHEFSGQKFAIGPAFLHGIKGNPIAQLASLLGLRTYPCTNLHVTTDCPCFSIVARKANSGLDVSEAWTRSFEKMIASKECFKSDFMKDSELKPDKVLDCGLDQALAAYDWNPSSPIDFAVDAFAADICCGASSHNISKIAEFASSSIYADDDYEVDNFIADGDGYVRILNYLATKAKVLSSANTLNEEIVHMNTVVNKIIWGDSSTGHFSTVHAYNQNKTLTYKAHYVIVTIPSSLYADKLEANDAYSSSVKFEPALPSELQQVLKCIRYSNYIRVFLAYTEAFWDPSDTILKVIDDILMEAGDNSNVNSCWFGNGDHPSRAFFCFQNPLPALKLTGQELKNPQLPVIICHISGDFADRLLDVSDEGLVRMVSESLASIYPNKAEIAKHPVESKVVSWAKEIYSKGAFAYARPGLKFSDLNKLTQKLTCSSKHGGLYLAGDAFTFEYLGCSQGAYLTGFKAAKSIIAEMN